MNRLRATVRCIGRICSSPLFIAAALLGGLIAVYWFAVREDPAQLFADGRAAIENDDPAAAMQAIKALERHPEYRDQVRFLQASCLFQLQDYEAVLRELSPVRPEGELRVPVLLLVGRCLVHQEKFIEAERIFRGLTIEAPELVEAHRWLVPIYRQMGAMDLALEHLQKVAELEPQDPRTYRLMAVIHKEDRVEYDRAIELYRQALERHPAPDDRAAICAELGDALVFQRDYKSAIDVLKDAEPDAKVWALRAECYWNLGDHAAAEKALEQALQQHPSERRALLLMADVEMSRDDPAAAEELLLRVLEQDPHDWEARYQLGLVYRKAGDARRAEATLEQAQESRKLRDQLNQLYRQARSRPADIEVRQDLVQLCRQLGRNRLADFWEQATELSRQATQ